MKNLLLSLLSTVVFFGCQTKTTTFKHTAKPLKYAGKPYRDSVHTFWGQQIPGKLECEFYDTGGEGVAYHDADDKNNGSGGLNKGLGYYANFRKDEAVDISFTKYHDSIDNSSYNVVQPKIDQLYVGWTEPSEWLAYTVQVLETGDYKLGAMYTSNRGGAIRWVVDDTDTTALLDIPSTFNEHDPIAWRNWHHWNYVDALAVIHLKKGKRVLKLEIVQLGNFNFDNFNFVKIKGK